ncbi:MAG: BolA/IbaG family iron-sulfur metabolism protein [Vampirovibrionales bacterium]
MIPPETLQALIQPLDPEAEITVLDKTGMQDHYQVFIRSEKLKSKPLLEAHRAVYSMVDEAMKSGALHALELKLLP